MLILTIRTDNPEAEIGLFDSSRQLVYEKWQAHRQLAETLHVHIAKNLQSVRCEWSDIAGIVVFEGPGSFTGLRIGLSVANALAYGLDKPIIAATGQNWLETGTDRLLKGENDRIIVPAYGAEPHITRPTR